MLQENYFTKTKALGGKVKQRIEDFVVEEVIDDQTVCKVDTLSERLKSKENVSIILPDKPDESSKALSLHMEKFNTDTQFAVKKIARWIRCSQQKITYAGVKDKRAVTCQRITIWDPDTELLQKFQSNSVCLKNPEWLKDKINLGSLKGNNFNIIIRDISFNKEETKEILEQSFEEIKDGIPNFFGNQRFGAIRPLSHLVGKALVEQNIEKAVMIYLTKVFEGEDEEAIAARTELEKTRDFAKAVSTYPNHLKYERAMIHHLCKDPTDFRGALRQLPKKLAIMFVHAYQSYLFNKLLQKRIELGYGLNEIEGDVLEDGCPTLPLFGFKSKFSEGKAGELEKDILEEEGFDFRDFYIREMRDLSSKGYRRQISIKPEDLKIISIDSDDYNENKTMANISFYLNKGSYATTVLSEITKKDFKE